jgi:hypothetical protein
VFNIGDLELYRSLLPKYFAVYFDEERFELVQQQPPACASDRDQGTPSRMTVVVDSVSYTQLSYASERKIICTPWEKY